MKLNEIKTPVSAITGVGPKLTKLFAKLNIFTIGDLLSFYPRDYEDRTKRVFLKDYDKFSRVHTAAIVIDHQWFGYGNMKTLKLIINDGTAKAELICFNRGFLAKAFPIGSVVSVTGQFFVKYSSLQSSAFEINPITIDSQVTNITLEKLSSLPLTDSKIYPIYSLTEGLTQKNISKVIQQALSQYAHGIENEIPDYIIKKRQLFSKHAALHMIHNPQSLEQAFAAKQTLIYEELFHFQYTIAYRSYKRRGILPSATVDHLIYENEKEVSDEQFFNLLSPRQISLLKKLPFKLTKDQQNVIYIMNQEIDEGYNQRNKILLELDSVGQVVNYKTPRTMARLLQGDVGSGKTLTALMVCLRIIDYGGQCAFMAPTEILAKQHAETISKYLSDMNVKTAFLTGNIKSSGRVQLLKALKNGDIDIIVGTHALFSSQVVYKDLQLAIIDEQHRFGVLQRQAIISKGRICEKGITFEPHVLMMSATPIPQTLALTVFGDLDISTIKTMPIGRKPIKTYLVSEGNEHNAYEAVRKELEKGFQSYFVYPAIDSDYSNNIKSAEQHFKLLSEKVFPMFKCALVHSKIEEEKQEQILKDFHENKIQVLIATTVIEVGVDVPNATCIVIEQADRFGMAQLHQLRGRVGRGSNQSYCFLIYGKNITETGIERMKALRQSTDGFYIAEQDLMVRGPGEVNGTLQAGNLELGIADVVRDQSTLLQARIDAIEVLEKNL